MLTGRSTVGMLFSGLVLPGTKTRSGMNAPNGTFMKRLLSISHTEQTGCSGRAAVAIRTASAAHAAAVTATSRICHPGFFIASSLPLNRDFWTTLVSSPETDCARHPLGVKAREHAPLG